MRGASHVRTYYVPIVHQITLNINVKVSGSKEYPQFGVILFEGDQYLCFFGSCIILGFT